jgi:hypothetical protein
MDMKSFLTFLALLAFVTSSLAAEIKKGGTIQVPPDRIWFEELDKLKRWQELKKSGDAKALETFQEEALGERDAWQFGGKLSVRVLSYEPRTNRVQVKMQTPGRMVGTTWWLDADAFR